MTHDEEQEMRAELDYQAYTSKKKWADNCPEIEQLRALKIDYAKLGAENKRQAAEVDRLTPKPMTPEEMAEVLNKYECGRPKGWEVRFRFLDGREPYLACSFTGAWLRLHEAQYVAQGLLRDAGPIAKPLEPKEMSIDPMS